MERIRRNERMAALTKILTASPNRIFTLSHFCDLFGAAKSTMSEDIDILKDVLTGFERSAKSEQWLDMETPYTRHEPMKKAELPGRLD